jgi:hypothetical protein
MSVRATPNSWGLRRGVKSAPRPRVAAASLGLPSLYLIDISSTAGLVVGKFHWVDGRGITFAATSPAFAPLYAPVGFVWVSVFYLVWVARPEPTNVEAMLLARMSRRVDS